MEKRGTQGDVVAEADLGIQTTIQSKEEYLVTLAE